MASSGYVILWDINCSFPVSYCFLEKLICLKCYAYYEVPGQLPEADWRGGEESSAPPNIKIVDKFIDFLQVSIQTLVSHYTIIQLVLQNFESEKNHERNSISWLT